MGGRWTSTLDEQNDRDIYIITDPKMLEANVIDVDLLRTMYKKIILEKRK